QAEALAAYQEARAVLADELGIEPSPALRELERQILQQDAALDLQLPQPPPPIEATPASVDVPEETVKLVTVLFADVVATTVLPPEEHRDRKRAYSAALLPALDSEGGTLETLAGDGIMAVFGAPTVHEDDSLRAVRAAWDMLQRLRTWNTGRAPGETLELRI